MLILLLLIKPEPSEQLLITYVALGGAVLAWLTAPLLPKMVEANNRKAIAIGTWKASDETLSNLPPPTDDTLKLLYIYPTRVIIRSAFLEGSVFFALISFMLEGFTPILIVVALGLLGIAIQFPTRDGIRNWLDQQLHLLKEQRQFTNS